MTVFSQKEFHSSYWMFYDESNIKKIITKPKDNWDENKNEVRFYKKKSKIVSTIYHSTNPM